MYIRKMMLLLRPVIFIFITIITYAKFSTGGPKFYYCYGSSYTSGSTYETNLKQLLVSLASNAPSNPGPPGGYYYEIVGAGTPNEVSGLTMCYADANQTECLNCLAAATDLAAIVSSCGYCTNASLHYDACFVHYASYRFFSYWTFSKPYCLQRPDGNSPSPGFLNSSSVASLVKSLTTTAASSPERYVNATTSYMNNQTVYGFVQCTKDLPADDCKWCVGNYTSFANSVNNCSDQLGARIMGMSCYIRYELYPFYVESYTSSSPPPPPLLSPPPPPYAYPSPPPPPPRVSPPPPPTPGEKSRKL